MCSVDLFCLTLSVAGIDASSLKIFPSNIILLPEKGSDLARELSMWDSSIIYKVRNLHEEECANLSI